MKMLKKYAANIAALALIISSLSISISARAASVYACDQPGDTPASIVFNYPTAASINSTISRTSQFTRVSTWPTCDASALAQCRATGNIASPYLCGTVSLNLPGSITTTSGESYNKYFLNPQTSVIKYTLDDILSSSFSLGSFLVEPASTSAPVIGKPYAADVKAYSTKTFTKFSFVNFASGATCNPNPVSTTNFSYTATVDFGNVCTSKGHQGFWPASPNCTGSGNTYTCTFCCSDLLKNSAAISPRLAPGSFILKL